ncbi:hypothetical protein [Paracoccus sp. (in: a-proteobacteria)]|uniref:hypothetical protein n=1 Tax=Paracoccus sp. TaxID=267 RepID=UPI0026DF3CEC|nr:hypothetical protein [Paracoccus sp. (in: a-proteobacteria)]MDO5647371.1 hypothetical protein [Paracoccus sp. (in: a-proteobacteria)]
MTSPITPEVCTRTGRLLTEWFEYPHLEDEDIKARIMEEAGIDFWPHLNPQAPPSEEQHLANTLTGKLAGFKARKWRYGMSRQEVAARLNEATKMVDPGNYKFLDDATRERTGLEVNPLWLMECLVRSGALNPKEQVTALKELAQYTHSKAATVNHNINANAPEDWLLELAKDEYKVIDAESFQPKTPRERGMGRDYEHKRAKNLKIMSSVQNYMEAGLAEMEAELGDFDFDLNLGEES